MTAVDAQVVKDPEAAVLTFEMFPVLELHAHYSDFSSNTLQANETRVGTSSITIPLNSAPYCML